MSSSLSQSMSSSDSISLESAKKQYEKLLFKKKLNCMICVQRSIPSDCFGLITFLIFGSNWGPSNNWNLYFSSIFNYPQFSGIKVEIFL